MSRKILMFIVLVSYSLLLAAEERWSVTTTEWAQPRSGEMLKTLPGVRAAMKALGKSMTSRLAIHHPGGDQAIWWAEELRGWFITLGLSSRRIELVPGSGEADMMYLYLIDSQQEIVEE